MVCSKAQSQNTALTKLWQMSDDNIVFGLYFSSDIVFGLYFSSDSKLVTFAWNF